MTNRKKNKTKKNESKNKERQKKLKKMGSEIKKRRKERLLQSRPEIFKKKRKTRKNVLQRKIEEPVAGESKKRKREQVFNTSIVLWVKIESRISSGLGQHLLACNTHAATHTWHSMVKWKEEEEDRRIRAVIGGLPLDARFSIKRECDERVGARSA